MNDPIKPSRKHIIECLCVIVTFALTPVRFTTPLQFLHRIALGREAAGFTNTFIPEQMRDFDNLDFLQGAVA